MTPLSDSKVFIVTGSARGLGKAMSAGLIAVGSKVLGVDLPTGNELSATAKEFGGNFYPVSADISQPSDCARVVDMALKVFGGLHGLVNNAGMGMQVVNEKFTTDPMPFWKVKPEQWDAMVKANSTTQFLMATACAPHLIDQKWGRIINITTSFITMQQTGYSPYGPSKAAAEAHTVIMSADLANTGVTANVLAPGGPADTRMIPESTRYPDRKGLVSPDQLKAPVVWLSSIRSNGFTGKRILAKLWTPNLSDEANIVAAVRPAGWS